MASGGGLLGASSVILAAPVLAYGLGYAYYTGFFGYFGVDITTVVIPVEHYFVQGVLSFLIALTAPSEMGATRLVPLLCSIVLLGALLFPQFARFRTIVAWVVIAPLLSTGVFGAFQQGREEAAEVINSRQVFLDLRGLLGEAVGAARSVGVGNACGEETMSDASWTARHAALARANECGRLLRIWQDNEATVVATRVCTAAAPAANACRWQVYRLASDEVAITATESDSGPVDIQGDGP